MATIRKRGSSWQVQIRLSDQPNRSRTFATKREALDWARREESGLQGMISKSAHPPQMRVSALVERYIRDICPAKRSGRNEAATLKAFLRTPWSSLRLEDATNVSFAAYRDCRLSQVLPGTVIRELGILQRMFTLAIEEWGIPLGSNPLKGLRRPKAAAGRNRRIGLTEWNRLSAALDQARNRWLKPIVQFAVSTAMRRGEILKMRWKDVDFEQSTVFLPHTKNGHSRSVPLPRGAIEVLERIPSCAIDNDKIFLTTEGALKLAWARAVKRAALEDLRFHDLRHEAISRFFEVGLSLPEVAVISGHRDPRMLLRYTHLRASDIATKLHALRSLNYNEL